jgi:hypothetical protein
MAITSCPGPRSGAGRNTPVSARLAEQVSGPGFHVQVELSEGHHEPFRGFLDTRGITCAVLARNSSSLPGSTSSPRAAAAQI